MAAGGLFDQLDSALSNIFADWNIFTTVAFTAIVGLIAYGIATAVDPDIHPLILSRQATASLIRNPGESAIYRSAEVPHGYPLRTGLDVKDENSKGWQAGRNGDLRDIWRRVTGELPIPVAKPQYGQSAPPTPATTSQPKILTAMGTEKVIEHAISELTKEIAIIGSCARAHGKRVAIYMPNSTELIVAFFACAFYGLDAILLPYHQLPTEINTPVNALRELEVDVLIARAGSLPIDEVSKQVRTLKQVIWFVEKTSRQVDWTEVPKHIGANIDVDAWHELIQNHQDSSLPQFPTLTDAELGTVTMLWEGNNTTTEVTPVVFTQENLVAAISAQINALPPRQRLGPSDLFFPAAPLTTSHTLCATLAALFSHASLALNSAVLPGIDLAIATRTFAPTVIVTSAETAAKLHAKALLGVAGGIKKFWHSLATQTLEKGTFAAKANAPTAAAIGAAPGKLRLLVVAEKAGVEACPPLSSADLNDLRIFTGARVVYALTAARVAGAVAQTSIFDYRREVGGGKYGHFGVPLSCVEVKVVDKGQYVTTEQEARGEIVVSGPAVAGGQTNLGVLGQFRDDATLAYI